MKVCRCFYVTNENIHVLSTKFPHLFLRPEIIITFLWGWEWSGGQVRHRSPRNSGGSLVIYGYCTARQCSPLRRKIMKCSINSPARSLLMKHLVIGWRQKAPNFSAFHWSPHGSLVSIGQHFVTTRVVHLPKRTETSKITKSDKSGPSHQLLQLCMACTA